LVGFLKLKKIPIKFRKKKKHEDVGSGSHLEGFLVDLLHGQPPVLREELRRENHRTLKI